MPGPVLRAFHELTCSHAASIYRHLNVSSNTACRQLTWSSPSFLLPPPPISSHQIVSLKSAVTVHVLPGPHTFRAGPAILISLVPLAHCPPSSTCACCQGSLQTKNRTTVLFCLKPFNDSPKPKKKTQTPQGPSWTGSCPYLPLWTLNILSAQPVVTGSIMQQILLPVHSATKQCYSLCLDTPSSSLSPPLNIHPSLLCYHFSRKSPLMLRVTSVSWYHSTGLTFTFCVWNVPTDVQ